jgi:DNA-binding transcriptional MocR family regulator
MSYKDRLSELDRGAESSLTSQIVDAFAAAIAAGELAPDEKLPPTRTLAELAGVNHLTAARAYRRLAELGLVTARVGQGTFVRVGATQAGDAAGGFAGENTDWQLYALPEELETYGDRILAEMFRQAGRDDVIPLMVGYPSDKLLPAEQLSRLTAEALADNGTRAHQYTDIEGVAELREQVAALHRAEGCDDSPDQIVVTTGIRQALTLTARAILRPGDTAAIESPTFPGSIDALRNAGASVLPVRVDEGGLDVDGLEGLLRRRDIRLLALQSRLHNPTGRDLAPERRERLCELAARYGFFIVEDGAYASLRFEGKAVLPLRAMLPSHVIYLSSLSKIVSPGMRTGWAAASGPVLERIVREKRNDDMHSATLTQLVAARFLADGGYAEQLDRAIPFYRERHDALLAAVARHLGPAATVARPLGGGHLWLTFRDALDERDLYDEAVRQGVTFLPGGAMMAERPRATQIRLSFGYLDPDELDEGVRRLAVAVRAVRPRPRREALPVT